MSVLKLPHRITIEVRAISKDSMGGQANSWTTLGVFYCRVSPLSGRALLDAQQLHAEVTHQIEMRYNAAVTAACRGRYRDRIFEFGAVMNMAEADVETRILAKEGLTQG